MISMILELIGGRKTVYGLVVGFLVGLLIGWFVIGWGVWPLEWEDAAPGDLEQTYENEIVKALADSYSLGNTERVKTVLDEGWEEEKDLRTVINKLKAEAKDDAEVQRLDALAQAMGISAATPAPGETPAPTPTTEKKPSLLDRLLPLCGVFVIVVAAVALAGLIVRILRRRRPEEEEVDSLARMQEAISPEIAEAVPSGTVLGHFITSYALGNDHYDESFSIEAEGDFMGECGVGIGETIGVGPPDKVTALEVWLFDKNAIRTETKVVMSTHAFNDDDLRSKLAPRGEPVLAEPDAIITLETTDLRIAAQITELAYSMDATLAESFFDRITFELVVYLREDGGEAQTEIFG